MTSSEETLEEQLESFAASLTSDDLSTADRRAVRRLMKDNLAVGIGSSVLPWSQAAEAYARERAREGPSTVAAWGHSMDPATAAFLNATMTHGFEYDDAHGPSDGHPGSVVTSVSLAVGEAVDARLEETMIALLVGYEVYAGIGRLASPELIGRGWHPHAVLGTFGSAVAAAKLWDLEEDQIRHALAIAASLASGPTEYSSTGGSIKRAHAGIAARNGIEAVRMAKNGLTGPRRYLTGNKGFFATFVETTGLGPDIVGTSGEFEIHEAWLKQYACCGCTHAYIDCVHALEIDPGSVDSIRARVQPKSDSIVGTANENLYRPTTIEEAQFNLPFEVALAVCGYGNGFPTHRKIVDGDIALDDPELLRMMGSIKLETDSALGEEYGSKFVGELTVVCDDGSERHAFVEDAVGTADNPPSPSDCRQKFDELTVPILGANTAETLWDTLGEADPETPIQDITSLIS